MLTKNNYKEFYKLQLEAGIITQEQLKRIWSDYEAKRPESITHH